MKAAVVTQNTNLSDRRRMEGVLLLLVVRVMVCIASSSWDGDTRCPIGAKRAPYG